MKGAVRCTCPSPGLRLSPDRRTCSDIDECVSAAGVCPRRRKCVNTFGSFLCKCHLGFRLTYINGRYSCIETKIKEKHLRIGAWNVRTLTDTQASDRPERRTAIISRELGKFQIDIAALSETRLADEGQLKEEKGGYTFFWKGKPANEPRIHGVGFAIKNCLINHLHELPVGINERLMTIRLMLASSQMATVISAYAPTLDAQDEVKEAFYADLDKILSEVPKEDKLILLGDFNARVGRNHHLWRGTLGREGVGNTNSNGILLLTKCSEHNLVITNTLFRQKTKFKTSWMHPRSKLWHLIDYVIVRSKDRRDVLHTRAMTSADDCWTDHRLIRSIMSIRLMRKRRMQKRQSRPKLNIDLLGDTTYQQQLQDALSAALPKLYPEDKDAIANRWKEHYKDLLNRDTIPEMEALDQLPQQPIVESMGEPPSLGEVLHAIKNMKNNKAAGPDGIPAEVLKKGGHDLLKHIHALLLKIWEEEETPAQLRDALIVSIFKKGDRG
ncbi:Craniofacial development protein 2 [Dissostichus eleginoides]|uniref:Craniofacial development protein 2 n=1 Tax=Dissostichus eleginoides TaxID=100907 RepID=A0AAD9F647_DISEL|nr:Craniofacial development protein 2 [Dissostichus eleginoides]